MNYFVILYTSSWSENKRPNVLQALLIQCVHYERYNTACLNRWIYRHNYKSGSNTSQFPHVMDSHNIPSTLCFNVCWNHKLIFKLFNPWSFPELDTFRKLTFHDGSYYGCLCICSIFLHIWSQFTQANRVLLLDESRTKFNSWPIMTTHNFLKSWKGHNCSYHGWFTTLWHALTSFFNMVFT